MTENQYGTELILDLFECRALPCTRHFIERFLVELCKRIEMEREDLHFWDYHHDLEAYAAAPDHLKGISAVQFIKTSNITIHTLDARGEVFLNVFSCKDFDCSSAAVFAAKWFVGKVRRMQEIARG